MRDIHIIMWYVEVNLPNLELEIIAKQWSVNINVKFAHLGMWCLSKDNAKVIVVLSVNGRQIGPQ